MILFVFILLLNAIELSHLEPDIQCTIIKVYHLEKIDGLKEFPKLYQSINNEPLTSRLIIAGKEFAQINPKSLTQTNDTELILIETAKKSILLEIKGKPISRTGLLKVNNKTIAEITCH